MNNIPFFSSAVKNAHTLKAPKIKGTNKSFNKPVKINTIYNTSVPTKPQYHPLGSSVIPGSEYKVATTAPITQNRVNLTKQAGIKDLGSKFIKDTLTPMNLGLSTLNIASGETSVGGELTGQATSTTARYMINPLLDKIYKDGVTPNTIKRKFGRGALGLITSIGAYIGGNYLGNKYIPIYKRKLDTVYKPSDIELNTFNSIYNKGYKAGIDKQSSFIKLAGKRNITNKTAVNKAKTVAPNVGLWGKTKGFAKDMYRKLPSRLRANIKIHRRIAPIYATIGGGAYFGNTIYNDKKNQLRNDFYTELSNNA